MKTTIGKAVATVTAALVLAALGVAGALGEGRAMAAGSAAQEALAATELAFARTAAAKGVKEAFLAYLDEDAVLFRPGAVPGKAWMRDHPAPSYRLSWRPTFVQVAKAGDLGYTTGPYEVRSADPKDTEVDYGRFVTVWRRSAEGPWRAVLDIGVPTPQPPAEAAVEFGPAPVSPAGSHAEPTSGNAGDRDGLLAADRSLSAAIGAQGLPAAYAASLASHARLLRPGALPVVGAEAIRAALAVSAAKIASQPAGGAASRSGDLGYTYGVATVQETAGGPARSESYLRLWERAPAGGWTVVLDLASPLPPPPG